ncbi:MerR family transcriptional regulator [Sporomusa sphaeroides]
MYAIGDMSKIHNVPIRTLRYYDKIGLFKPSFVDQGTGYRYYSTEQFEQLNIIKYLKSRESPIVSV